MYDFFNAQSKLRDAAQWGCGGWKSSTARPFSDDFGEILAGRRSAPRRMHSVRAGCSYFLVTSPRAISIMECGQKINTQSLAYYYKLLSPFLLIFHMLIEIPRYKVRFCALSLANEHYSEKFKETLDFFWMNLVMWTCVRVCKCVRVCACACGVVGIMCASVARKISAPDRDHPPHSSERLYATGN